MDKEKIRKEFDEQIKQVTKQAKSEVGQIIREKELVLQKLEVIAKYKGKKPADTREFRELSTVLCFGSIAFCVPEGTPILLSNLSWKPIEKIEKGDEVFGFSASQEYEERLFKPSLNINRPSSKEHPFFAKAKVTDLMSRQARTLCIKTDKGILETTPEHPLLGGSSSRVNNGWRRAELFTEGDWIRFFSNMTGEMNKEYLTGWVTGYIEGDGCFYNRSSKKRKNKGRQFKLASIDPELRKALRERVEQLYGIKMISAKCFHNYKGGGYILGLAIYHQDNAERLEEETKYLAKGCKDYHCGYLGGMFDAEGCFSNSILSFTQKSKKTIAHILHSLDVLHYRYNIYKKQNQVASISIAGGFSEKLRFLLQTMPVLQRKKDNLCNLTIYASTKAIVQQITKGKIKTVYNLETETGNYIANGFFVHNCCATPKNQLGAGKGCLWRDEFLSILGISEERFLELKEVLDCAVMVECGIT